MFYKQQNVSRLTLILIMAALTLTACGGNADTQPSSENTNESAPGIEGAQSVDSESSTLAVNDPPDPSDNGSDSADSESPTLTVNDLPGPGDNGSGSGDLPELGFALGDPNLKVTNPRSVTLASGQIQVLEFFAYW